MLIDCNALRYYRTGKLWPKLQPIFESPWCREMWKEKMRDYTFDREWCELRTAQWLREPNVTPDWFDSSDWRCLRNGRLPEWYRYVVWGACHYMAPVYYAVITELEPEAGWTLMRGVLHSTVCHFERGLVFDPQFEALRYSAAEAFRSAAFCTAEAVRERDVFWNPKVPADDIAPVAAA